MNNTKKSLKVLFIGESWHIHMIHSKGYDSFTSSKYEEGATWLLQCLKNSQVDVTYMLDWPPESPDNQYHLNK